MRLQNRVRLLLIAAVVLLSLFALPETYAPVDAAGKQITITITEAQFTKYLQSVRSREIKKLEADIIDGGIIVKITTRWIDVPVYHEHYGVLIRDGKLVTECGVVDIPDVGALGYADVQQIVPDLIPVLDHNAKVMDRFVQRQVTAKAGRRYTVESVATGEDKVVIVVNR